MKLLIINTTNSRGGAANFVNSLVESLEEMNNAIKITYAHSGDNSNRLGDINLEKFGSRNIIALQSRLINPKNIFDFGATSQLMKLIDEHDVIHLHNLHGYYMNYLNILRYLRYKPVVWTWHDMWPVTGRCAQAGTCVRWTNECYPCPKLNIYPMTWIDHSHADYKRKYDLISDMEKLTIACPSSWLASIANKRKYTNSRIVTIENACNTAIFNEKISILNDKQLFKNSVRPTVLFVASNCNDPGKGFLDYCVATSSCSVNRVVVGVPPSELPPNTDDILFLGVIRDKRQLASIYATADVMIIPSYADTYPSTVIESLCCGTPVIGYATGGIPSQLVDRFSKCCVTGDILELTAAITNFTKNCESIRHHREELSRASISRWSMDRMVKSYIDLYNSALSEI